MSTAKPDLVTHWLKHAAKFVELAVEAQAAGDRVTMIVGLQCAAECVQIAKLNQGGHHGRLTPAPPSPEHDAPNELYGGGGS